ncbi:MAG: carboxymuconolactone decarboxylase family protein [Proteobacteria bacterium]|nr:carboxymuconolactone decarboxylase family protein [Pseudomonadota bacterium]
MADSEAFTKGSEIRRKLMGDAYVERLGQTVYTDETMAKFGRYATEAVFGMLWSRPGLDLKTRTLICVISDTVMGREAELRIHLRMALRQAWTEDELIEAILHLSGYCGLPLVREALICARDTFAELRAEG